MTEVLFCAGEICKSIIPIWKLSRHLPAFIVDDNMNLWGSYIEDVEICNPHKIVTINDEVTVYITCSNRNNNWIKIRQKINDLGIDDNHIHILESWHKVIPRCIDYMQKHIIDSNYTCNMSNDVVTIFDLENGLVPGGVEAWSFQTASQIREIGQNAMYITRIGTYPNYMEDESMFVIDIEQCMLCSNQIINMIMTISRQILSYKHVKFVSNFGGVNFFGACLAKSISPNTVEHICVVHTDLAALYDEYVQMQKYIDVCVTISDKINREIINRNFPSHKIRRMTWDVDIENNLVRKYSDEKEPIRIGYAGRITVRDKRIDLIIKVLEIIHENHIPFICEIAGIGESLDMMMSYVSKSGIGDKIIFHGYIERNNLSEFWKRQDIMISCSDREGHCITQVEAMANGAVPVITDVSGARDDVVDGENGYVCPIGDIEYIAGKISYLYSHKDILRVMGVNSHSKVAKNKLSFPSCMEILGIMDTRKYINNKED